MQSFDFKKYLPHLLIIVGFALFSIFYSMPAFQGMILSQHDIISWKAAYHETEAYHDSTGINPLWTNSMFGGMPNYTIGIPENSNLLSPIYDVVTGILLKPAYFFFTAMLCFFILMQVMGINRWISVIGSIAYAFATYNPVIISAGHDTKMMAIALMPAVLGGLMMLYKRSWLGGAALLGISLAFMVSTAHYQVLYYAMILIFFYVIGTLVVFVREKRPFMDFVKASVIGLIVAAIAIGPSMGHILSTREYADVTMRGGESELTINKNPADAQKKRGGLDKDYAFRWSNGVGETFCVMIPYLYGGSTSEPIEKAPESAELVGGQAQELPLYWGPQAETGIFSGPVYFGAIICFLFVLGLVLVRSTHKWWIAVVVVLGIMMACGKHLPGFNYWLFDNLPMYNKFRTPTIAMILPQLLFPMLGMWALMEVIRGKVSGDDIIKAVKIAGGITVGLCLLLGLAGGMFGFTYTNETFDAQLPQQLLPALKNDRSALATKSALTSAFYIAAAAGLIWAFAKGKVNRTIMLAGIGLLVTIDLVSVANNYLSEDNYMDESQYESIFTARPVDEQILRDKDPYYRVLDLSRDPYNDAIQSYWHKAVGGYSPAKMETYQDLIDVHMGGAQSKGKFNAEVLNMLNTKYIIFKGPSEQTVYQPNPGVNGNAWFVEEAKVVTSADEEMLSMNAGAIGDTAVVANAWNSKKTAIIRQDMASHVQGYQFGRDSSAAIRLTKYGLNELSFASNNSRDGLAVFSDIYYPFGWKAFVDGKETPIFRVNYVLRGIKVPHGQHNIEFRFHPDSFYIGDRIALITSAILILLLLAAIWFFVRRKDTVANETEAVAI